MSSTAFSSNEDMNPPFLSLALGFKTECALGYLDFGFGFSAEFARYASLSNSFACLAKELQKGGSQMVSVHEHRYHLCYKRLHRFNSIQVDSVSPDFFGVFADCRLRNSEDVGHLFLLQPVLLNELLSHQSFHCWNN
jgi:hypothetical protein